MNFDSYDIKVVDSMANSRRTASIINMINRSRDDKRFIYIASSLAETEIVASRCKEKHFKAPKDRGNKTKLDDLKNLMRNGSNIVSTHALFQNIDNELIDICKKEDYTLILDGVSEVIQEYYMSSYDLKSILSEFAYTKEDTKQLVWKERYKDYVGSFDKHKHFIDLGSLVCYGNNSVCCLFPIEAFRAFKRIYILTYRFDSRLQKYYFDYYNIPYSYMSIKGNSLRNYYLVDPEQESNHDEQNYANLINICKHEKLNRIGESKTALSKAWYDSNKSRSYMRKLKNNIYNYFLNITGHGSQYNMWTTFKDYEEELRGKGYGKGFLPLNAKGDEGYSDKDCIVYPVNRYLNPFVKNFLLSNKINVDEDEYALTEMLEFIWQSGIQKEKNINIYVPSIRMRKLLENWIEENSVLDFPTEQSKEE